MCGVWFLCGFLLNCAFVTIIRLFLKQYENRIYNTNTSTATDNSNEVQIQRVPRTNNIEHIAEIPRPVGIAYNFSPVADNLGHIIIIENDLSSSSE